MSEIGHIGRIGGGVCIDAWGSGPFFIKAGGKSFRFGDSDRFGPYLATKHGDPTNAYLSERSPFWRAHRIWVRQGRRLEDDGKTCVWDEPKPSKVRRLSRSSVYQIEAGEEDGKMLVEGEDF